MQPSNRLRQRKWSASTTARPERMAEVHWVLRLGEVDALMRHFDAPWRIPSDPNARGWVTAGASESTEAVA